MMSTDLIDHHSELRYLSMQEGQTQISSGWSADGDQPWQPLESASATRRRRWRTGLMVLFVTAILVGAGYVYWQYRITPRLGRVTETVRGRVMVQDNALAPQIQAEPGRVVRPGARLYAETNAVARVTFFDESAFRIDSEGIWLVSEVSGSRNGRLSRVSVRQVAGDAVYVSRVPQQGVDSAFAITVEGAVVELEGMARLSINGDEICIAVIQGQAVLESADGSPQAMLPEGRSATLVAGVWQPL